MINITKYLKERGYKRTDAQTRNFLRSVRVQYYIRQNNETAVSKTGRYGYTEFSDGLFNLFLQWLEKKPIKLLNRKEYEVNDFLNRFFEKDLLSQYHCGNYIYDWYIPSINLFVEFNENTHKSKIIAAKDRAKNNGNVYAIREDRVMEDLADLVKLFYSRSQNK